MHHVCGKYAVILQNYATWMLQGCYSYTIPPLLRYTPNTFPLQQVYSHIASIYASSILHLAVIYHSSIRDTATLQLLCSYVVVSGVLRNIQSKILNPLILRFLFWITYESIS